MQLFQAARYYELNRHVKENKYLVNYFFLTHRLLTRQELDPTVTW